MARTVVMRGLDYSVGRPSAAQVKAAGYRFVIRYTGNEPDRPKEISGTEYRDMTRNGVGVVLTYENRTDDMLGGRPAGQAAARAARANANELGHPRNRPIYFACDMDIVTGGQFAAVVEYLRGCSDILGVAQVGVYGEADVIDRVHSAGVARWFWQTRAWSGGRVSANAHVLQQVGSVTVGGVICDRNDAFFTDIGQWPEEDDMPDKQTFMAWMDEWATRRHDLPGGAKAVTLTEFLEQWPRLSTAQFAAVRQTNGEIFLLMPYRGGLCRVKVNSQAELSYFGYQPAETTPVPDDHPIWTLPLKQFEDLHPPAE